MDQRPDQTDPATPRPPRPPPHVALAQCVRFYSRIPISRLPGETDRHAPPHIESLPGVLPFAALIIAAPACVALWAGDAVGFPALIIAALAIATLLLTTGAFHEDGLADVADGFGGGATLERKLEIMKDSRVGTYGACAVCLSILIRVIALAALIETRPIANVIALVLTLAALSRVAGLIPLAALPPARADGASKDVGRPTMPALAIGFALSAMIAGVASALAGWPAGLGLTLIFGAAIAGVVTTALAARQINGQTGDVAGAAQQIAEMTCFIIPLATIFAR